MPLVKQWDFNRRGVDLYDDHLFWWESGMDVSFASGAACDQSFDSFLAHGPQYPEIPGEMLTELTQAVRQLVKKRKP